jgi:hypothetical protein
MKCTCCGWAICESCLQLTIAVIASLFGGLVAWKPRKVIDTQIALYRPFNWKIEPISMEKEIRNTRIMGLVVLILGVISLGYVLLLK